VIIHCALCQTRMPPGASACPGCGSDDVMVGMQLPSGTIVSVNRDGASGRVNGTRHEKVRGTWLRQHVKREWSATRQQWEYVERAFNRVEGTYDEVYYHPVTGEVVYEKHAAITDQSAHGRRGRR
jgi:hypothetical protein